MRKSRLEAFSDAVLAIIITIMVLEFKVPHGADLEALLPLWPKFLSYILSFVYLAIYWNNHHHLFQAVKEVNGAILWANVHLLFWLSIVPFVTAWSGENNLANIPVMVYGIVLFMAAIAYFILTRVLLGQHGPESPIAKALGKDFKGKISIVLYAVAIISSFWLSIGALILYVIAAGIWIIPDRRMEKVMK